MLKQRHKSTLWKTRNYYNDNKSNKLSLFTELVNVNEILSGNYVASVDWEKKVVHLKWAARVWHWLIDSLFPLTPPFRCLVNNYFQFLFKELQQPNHLTLFQDKIHFIFAYFVCDWWVDFGPVNLASQKGKQIITKLQ